MEKVETEDMVTTLKKQANAIRRMITKYDDLDRQDKVRELENKLNEVLIVLYNYSNPDKPMKFIDG